MTDIESVIKDIAGLKPVPRIVNKVLSLAQDPESSMSDVADVIAYDAMATANLLKAANSAYYGRATPFDSIHQAIVFMGMDEVVDLVLLTNSAETLKRRQEGYGLNAGDLWRYSVTSALLAREIAIQKNLDNTHLVFTSALLKDIGKVVLEQYVGNCIDAINAKVNDDGASFREAEKEVIGIDHAELGALVARVWQFSPRMVDIIANHHQPHEAILARKETAAVYAGDVLCMMMGGNGGRDGLAYRFHEDTLASLDITETDLQNFIAGYAEELDKIEELIS